MIAGLQKVDTIVLDQINEAVFFGQSAGPRSRSQISEGFRLTDASKGVAHDCFH